MKTIHFGIIGTGTITHRFIRGARKVENVNVYAVSSRSKEKAEAYCKAYPGMRAYGDYREMCKDPMVDAVYIATPNGTHFTYIMEALKHGLHVMCEKPMVLHEAEVAICFAKAKERGLLLMEAMKPCFLPTTRQAQAWIQEGRIGKLQAISAGYCYNHVDQFLSGWHADKTKGGGALYDVGVYPLAFVNHMVQSEPIDAQLQQRVLPSGVDGMSTLQLAYANGVLAQLRCAVDMAAENQAILYGSEGNIIIPEFWKSEKAVLIRDGQEEEFFEPHDQSEFKYQIQAFIEDIYTQRCEDEQMSEAATRRNARIIDAKVWGKGVLS